MPDYARLDEKWRQHHVRFVTYVERHGVPCMDCRGRGGWREPILDDGSGPWYECGWCEGTGYMTRHARGLWLSMKKEEKRRQRPCPSPPRTSSPASSSA